MNDPDGVRCVDIRLTGTDFGWVECRRDPEDNHGWRLTGMGEGGFSDADAARAAAARQFPWVGA